jgi:hypothetical protein
MGLLDQKIAIAATTPIATALRTYEAQKKWPPELPADADKS